MRLRKKTKSPLTAELKTGNNLVMAATFSKDFKGENYVKQIAQIYGKRLQKRA